MSKKNPQKTCVHANSGTIQNKQTEKKKIYIYIFLFVFFLNEHISVLKLYLLFHLNNVICKYETTTAVKGDSIMYCWLWFITYGLLVNYCTILYHSDLLNKNHKIKIIMGTTIWHSR